VAEETLTGKETDARQAWINQVVAERYEVLEAVGETPYLWIFRVRDQQQNRIQTLRLLRGDVPEREEVESRLTAGWKEALALQHSGIVRAHDPLSDPERGLCGLTTEFVRGISLRERIRRAAPFSLSVAVDIALAIAASLEYAHGRGVAHGDLQPDRVLLPSDSAPQLTGFGEASEPRRAAADLQALGAILYQMLTAELPVRESGGWLSPRKLNQAIPRALEGITLKALGPGYGAASELVADLKAVKDALREGGTLAWSPLAEPVVAAPAAVMPAAHSTATNRRVSRPTVPRAANEPPQEEPQNVKSSRQKPGIGRWFVSFNLLMLVALGVLAWYLVSMVMKIMVPPGEVVVPDLVGKTLEEAETLGRKARFEVIEHEKKNQVSFPAGTIYMQREQKGMKVREGQKIYVGISLGPVTVVVPSVTEMLLEKAKKELDKSGMRMGQVTYRYDFMSKGNVIEQEPTAGERRPKGAPVNLVVSKGDEPTPEPTAEPTPEPLPEPDRMETPPPDPAQDAPESSVGRSHSFSVPKEPYQVPRDGKSHRIRIDVEDEEGKHTEYDAQHEPGESVQASVSVTGKALIRLYDNDVLQGEARVQ
jgi:eukaryotic-like serine/threonine-protein kinase